MAAKKTIEEFSRQLGAKCRAGLLEDEDRLAEVGGVAELKRACRDMLDPAYGGELSDWFQSNLPKLVDWDLVYEAADLPDIIAHAKEIQRRLA